ncbi:hypothetical protein TWF225_002533 [Orbilia oligospora]|nr:hypothetical protein TWF225_002533 [Orbilia oligospora]KAF3266224.1 hypothetical protein TWF217_001901 [Orbilia oligospora]KAF3268663.1 hypothetical protein TWF128_007038 [Orbilia oligospora]KAF3297123.1 hypothetical protein TWF132_008481 [Orbilia oligospora]
MEVAASFPTRPNPSPRTIGAGKSLMPRLLEKISLPCTPFRVEPVVGGMVGLHLLDSLLAHIGGGGWELAGGRDVGYEGKGGFGRERLPLPSTLPATGAVGC